VLGFNRNPCSASPKSAPKPHKIPKKLVLAAFKRVKASRGAAGIDNQSIEAFEADLKNNLYKIWNRMSSGSYFPPPVKAVEIPKKSGGTRVLGVPTVADRVAQMVVKLVLEPVVEPVFHPDSYGYRPGRSAAQALGVTRERCWRYPGTENLKQGEDTFEFSFDFEAIPNGRYRGTVYLPFTHIFAVRG